MKKPCLTVFILLSFATSYAKFNRSLADSPSLKLHFHFGISLKPVVNWLKPIDSAGIFFNSPVQYEPQLSYGNHYLVFGFNYMRNIKEYTVNNQPNQNTTLNYSICPSYQYKIYANKKWSLFPGLAFIYTSWLDDYSTITPLEIISKTTKTNEKGIAPYFRIGYQFNKYMSLEMETAYYFKKSTYSYESNYPLTPSLGTKSIATYTIGTFSAPSNIFLKISF